MREAILELLRCPLCKRELRLAATTREGAHITGGALKCDACDARWPIVAGVPDFVAANGRADVEQTTRGFALNWKRYSSVILAQPALNDELFRDWIAPVQPEAFEGRVVLDAGCGMGRWLMTAVVHAPRALVGFDYSEVAHEAYANTRHLKRVHIVRADLFNLPMAPAFDVCYSIGVVHHTPEPERAFACLLDAVKPDGVLAVWVYGSENNAWIERVVSPVRHAVTSRLPDAALHALTRALTMQLALAATGYTRAFPRPTRFPYDAYARHLLKYPRSYLEHIVYDHLTPQLVAYLSRDELAGWARRRDLAVSLTARNANSWRLVVAREPGALAAYGALRP